MNNCANEVYKLQDKGIFSIELFASDIHGEYNAFSHLLRTGSGTLREYIEAEFGERLSKSEKAELLSLIAYPEEKCAYLESQGINVANWLTNMLPHMRALARYLMISHDDEAKRNINLPLGATATKTEAGLEAPTSADTSTHSSTNGSISTKAALIGTADTSEFTESASLSIPTTTAMTTSDALSTASKLAMDIQHTLVNHLHLVGDVFDRGPAPDLIMDELLNFPNIDIQWGNHDILWMGAALGQPGSVANVVRICARYGNLSLLEDAYGINLRPLANFANETYGADPCELFTPKGNLGLTSDELQVIARMQKAMAIIQFKVEAAIIKENPSFGLENRNLLHLVDMQNATVVVDGIRYDMLDTYFPTVNTDVPYKLSQSEQELIDYLCAAFQKSERLQRHARFFLEKGGLYRIQDNNLLLHACVPLNDDGSLKEVELFGQTYCGKSLYDKVDELVRAAFEAKSAEERKRGLDMLWYLWLGPGSPLFAKSKMATFELYFIDDKAARKEEKNTFYKLLEDDAVLDAIFVDFCMEPKCSRIICGHVPVKAKDGEDPVKAGGRVLMIDGGFSKAYQKTTGLAGYTLLSSTKGMFLDANEPLESREAAVQKNADIQATRRELNALPGLQ